MKSTERVILISVVIAGLVLGVFKFFRLYGASYSIFALILTVLILGLYYVASTNFGILSLIFLSMLFLPLGVLFKLNHWPPAPLMLILGLFGHTAAGIYLAIKHTFKPLTIINKIAFSLLTMSLTLTVIFFYVPHVFYGYNLISISCNVIFLSGLQLLVTNTNNKPSTESQRIIILSVAIAFMPFLSWVVALSNN